MATYCAAFPAAMLLIANRTMTIQSWNPTPAASFKPDAELLQRLIELSRQPDQLAQLGEHITSKEQQLWQPMMKLDRQFWIDTGLALSTDDTQALIRFFTCAEMQLQGWDAGETSPVIGLVKSLRQRKEPPAKELLLWIKANSTNRFLPNGPLLG